MSHYPLLYELLPIIIHLPWRWRYVKYSVEGLGITKGLSLRFVKVDKYFKFTWEMVSLQSQLHENNTRKSEELSQVSRSLLVILCSGFANRFGIGQNYSHTYMRSEKKYCCCSSEHARTAIGTVRKNKTFPGIKLIKKLV